MARPKRTGDLFGRSFGPTGRRSPPATGDVEQLLQARYSVLRTKIEGVFSVVDALLTCVLRSSGKLVLILMLGFAVVHFLGVESAAFRKVFCEMEEVGQVAAVLIVVHAGLKLNAWLNK